MLISYQNMFLSATETSHHVAKRDEEYSIPKPLIVLLIMVGALILVCMGYAIHKTFGFGHNPHEWRPFSAEQQEYMAEVRVRNMEKLMNEGAKSRGIVLRQAETVY